MRARTLVGIAGGLVAAGFLVLGTVPACAGEAPSPFAKGEEQWGLALGQGTGLAIFGSEGGDAEDVRFVGLVPSWTVGLSDPVGVEHWYRGNLELRVEGALFVAYGPKGGFIGGANAVFRYNFLGCGRVAPFVELGAGLAYLELDLDSQADGLGFTPQGGLGLLYRLSERTALSASWRLHHLSNAGIYDDNDGINDSLLLIGVSWQR